MHFSHFLQCRVRYPVVILQISQKNCGGLSQTAGGSSTLFSTKLGFQATLKKSIIPNSFSNINE